MRPAWISLVFALFLALPAAAFAAPTAVALDDPRARVPIGLRADALADPSGTLTIDDVVRRGAEFRAAHGLDLTGTLLHPRIYWLRFTPVRGTSNQQWAFLIPSQAGRAVGRVDLYSPRAAGGWDHVRGGLDVPGDDAISRRVLVLPNSSYGATNYARVVSAGDPGSLALVSMSAGFHDVLVRNTFDVFFIGYFVAIASVYLLLYAILRQRSLLQYAAVMASVIALVYEHSTAAYGHLTAMTIAQRQLLDDVLFFIYLTLLTLFATTFLRLLDRDRFGFWLIAAAYIVNAMGFVEYFASVPGWVDAALSDLIPLAFFAALLIAGVRAWRAGLRPALFFTLGVAIVIAGYVFVAIAWTNPATAPVFLGYAFEAALALETLLLGIAVTERIRETTREYDRLLMASREFEDMALRDALTGALNRRAFDRGLADAWHTGAERGECLGLLMIDVDHFKLYNDRYGHQAGDECLRRIAQACASSVRGGDLFVRYGGEEFAAILPKATMDDLDAISRRMREAVAMLFIEHQTPSGHVTISIGGAANFATDVRSEQSLVKLADAALYRAKEEGRDRTVLDGDLVA